MAFGPFYAALPTDGGGHHYVDQPSWDQMMGNFSTWQGNVNANGFTLSALTGITLTSGSIQILSGYFYTTFNASGAYPTSSSSGGCAIGWNFTTGLGEVDFWNLFNSAGTSFNWYQKTGASAATLVMSVTNAGLLTIAGGLTASSTLSVTSPTGTPSNFLSVASVTTGANLYAGITNLRTAWTFGEDGSASGGAQDQFYFFSTSKRLVINTNGNVGVNTGTPIGMLHAHVNTNINAVIDAGLVLTTGISISSVNDANSSNEPMEFNASVYRFRVGDVAVGDLTPTFNLQLLNDSAAKPSTSTWTVSSDARVKKNVQVMNDDSIAAISGLRFVRAQYNGLGGIKDGTEVLGLVAQEAQIHMPDAVRTYKAKLNHTDQTETDLLGIDYHAVIVHSAKAIQQIAAALKSANILK